MTSNHRIAILASATTLGVYVPALTLYHQLVDEYGESNVFFFVYEDLYGENLQKNIQEVKKLYHSNFKIALMGQKISVQNNSSKVDQSITNDLLGLWYKSGINKFLVFSGFWTPVLNYFYKQKKFSCNTIILDAIEAQSWKSESPKFPVSRYELFSIDREEVNYFINIKSDEYLEEKSNSIIVHGGGWGIGTYQKTIKDLDQLDKHIYCLTYFEDDIKTGSNAEYLCQDPSWRPGSHFNSFDICFPRLIPVSENAPKISNSHQKTSDLYELVKKSKAIVSKPGGGTLIDSFSANTPILFLDRFGDHEEANAQLWKKMGFGMEYDEWKNQGFPDDSLSKMSKNIQTYKTTRSIKNLMRIIA